MHRNETYMNETWPVNNMDPAGSSSRSVLNPWIDASQARLLENQYSNPTSPGFAVPAIGQYYLIGNQHPNSVYSEGEEFNVINDVQVIPMHPQRADPGEFYLFANQQFSSAYPEGPFLGEQFCNIDYGQVDSVYPEVGNGQVDSVYPEVADLLEQFSIDDLTDCNNQSAVELGESYQYNYGWPSQAGGGEGASSTVSTVSTYSCQTVCSTPEASLSPIATDPSADKSWLQPAEHPFTSPEAATSDFEVTKKKKPRKCQCEVRISKKLPKSNDMLRQKLWLTFNEAGQAHRAKRVATYLLSGSKTKYMDTPFDPEFELEIRALRHDVQENGVTAVMFNKVKDLAERYGKHGVT